MVTGGVISAVVVVVVAVADSAVSWHYRWPALSGSEGALIERLQEDDETATGR